jgi:hypothetical protein
MPFSLRYFSKKYPTRLEGEAGTLHYDASARSLKMLKVFSYSTFA